MKILMISWEYPPKSVGGLAQHVYDLTIALNKRGAKVYLLTCGLDGAPEREDVHGVQVIRVNPYQVSSPDFTTWAAQFNVALLEKAMIMPELMGGIDLIHAHDWLVAYAARAIKHAFRLPLVSTIHATEWGRNHGLHNTTQRHISDIEWWLTYESWKVICCSKYMHDELSYIFQLPSDKLKIIPNGVNVDNFLVKTREENVGDNREATRENYAAADEKIVFYVGRLVREKGVQVLLDAAPQILSHFPKTKFVIAGKGPFENALRRQAENHGLSSRVYFTGYVDDDLRNLIYSWSDIAVFPSLYEPFGIVALEGMATKTPVIVSDTGGISGIVNHGVDGLKAYTGDSHSLAEQIMAILGNPELGERMKRKAYEKVVKTYNWDSIARETLNTYEDVLGDYHATPWTGKIKPENKILNMVPMIFGRYN